MFIVYLCKANNVIKEAKMNSNTLGLKFHLNKDRIERSMKSCLEHSNFTKCYQLTTKL